MQSEQIVALLVAERNRLEAAIQALQGTSTRRGRPPGRSKSVATASGAATVLPKGTMSAAGRKAIAEGARKRWAAIKAGKAGNPFAKAKRKAAKKG